MGPVNRPAANGPKPGSERGPQWPRAFIAQTAHGNFKGANCDGDGGALGYGPWHGPWPGDVTGAFAKSRLPIAGPMRPGAPLVPWAPPVLRARGTCHSPHSRFPAFTKNRLYFPSESGMRVPQLHSAAKKGPRHETKAQARIQTQQSQVAYQTAELHVHQSLKIALK